MEAESLFWPRLRWRMRGAWQWPSFFALTAVDSVVLVLLPFYGTGLDALGAVLVAGFFNLLVIAVLAPLVGRRVRARRPDLPRMVANDYAGTALLALVTVALVAGGLVHRPERLGEQRAQRAALASVHDYVLASAPRYRHGLAATDMLRLEPGLYRACVPGPNPRRWLCLFVRTTQSPPGVRRDPDQGPNSAYQTWR